MKAAVYFCALESLNNGLQGMAGRLEAICGEPAIESSPGDGTTALDRVPRSGRRS
ncbi:MAG TPA: hypothetical protein VI364_08085 [Actinomycetota bacterium]